MNKPKDIVTVADLRGSLARRFLLIGQHPFEHVTAGMTMAQQDDAIRRNYLTLGKRVELGLDDWNGSSPYEIGDWAAILTPVEFGAWQDIRSAGLPLWPRLPVGRFMVSFGNPMAKVALQCDNEELPCVDYWLKQTGWRVFRATAVQCTRVMESPADLLERTGEVSDSYRARYQAETLVGTMQDLRHALIAAGASL